MEAKINIFVVDADPVISAQSLCDKHVVKMILESAQMLSTAHHELDSYYNNVNSALYKSTHVNHPCSIWTRESHANYKWLYDHFVGLSNEYTFRYGKIHKSYSLLKDILATPPFYIQYKALTPFAIAMKSNPECIFHDDAIKSYRAYYKTKQNNFVMKWTNRDIPAWFKDET
jgi:two-component SAPR family response regulator